MLEDLEIKLCVKWCVQSSKTACVIKGSLLRFIFGLFLYYHFWLKQLGCIRDIIINWTWRDIASAVCVHWSPMHFSPISGRNFWFIARWNHFLVGRTFLLKEKRKGTFLGDAPTPRIEPNRDGICRRRWQRCVSVIAQIGSSICRDKDRREPSERVT